MHGAPGLNLNYISTENEAATQRKAMMDASHKYFKVFNWGKLIFITGSTQVFIQLTGLITGIIIIRMLSPQEYAVYTISNTMLGTMNVLADGGISTGVMAIGGQLWQDKSKLGQVLNTGLDLRKSFAIFSLLITVPILIYLLWHQGAQPIFILLIVLAIITTFYSAISDALLEIVPKLHQDIKPLQAKQAIVSVFRLILSSTSVFFLPFAFIALFANGLPTIYGYFRLKKIAANFADKDQSPNPAFKSEILKIVKKRMPQAIYYCVSSQITIWLIAIFGNSTAIAQIGALGRISMVLTLFTVLFATLLTPRFARYPEEKQLLFKRFLFMLSVTIGISMVIIFLVYLFPTQVLFILGKNYSNLSGPLLLSVSGGCLAMISGCLFSLSNARGWVMNPVLLILLNVLTIIIGILVLDLSSIYGVLYLNILIAAVQILMMVVFVLKTLTSLK